MILFDTNICIYALKGTFPSIETTMKKHPPASFHIPSIVKAELFYGAQKSQDTEKTINRISQFLLPFEVIPFDEAEAEAYAKIRADLEQSGHPIGPNDLIIAATAISRDATLVTHNTDEFGRVEGLKMEDWC